MTIKEAVTGISKSKTIIGGLAKKSLQDKNYINFAHMIKEQYNHGNGATLVAVHGFDNINTIIKSKL